jgi:outer membrane PBP1 activator LpoA protein
MISSFRTRLIPRQTLVLVMAALLLAGCATAPATFPRPAPEYARPPQPDGEFSQLEAKIRQTHGDDSSGFLLLDENREGLEWRLALVDSAPYA